MEVATLLSSGAFSRAPSLASLLTYVCEKYFEGEADQLKEYNLAVEALGRSPDFDNKKDSVVRVEAHRLRKRLQEYYREEGAQHDVQITIPAGQYAPKFVYRDAGVSLPSHATVESVEPVPPVAVSLPQLSDIHLNLQPVERGVDIAVLPPEPRRSQVWLGAGILLAVVAAGGLIFLWAGNRSSAASATIAQRQIDEVFPTGDEIRILAGSDQPYQDSAGRRWSPDRFFVGGNTFSDTRHQIFGTRDPRIFQTRREGIFRYDIPLKPGTYELRLYFAETLYGEFNIASGGESTRTFSIRANGRPVLNELDVIADAGPSAADIRVFKDISPGADGLLHLQFDGLSNLPFLNGIEITPGITGKLRPIRIVARDRPYTDKLGRIWEADHYVKGGQLVTRADPVVSTEDPDIYRGERFGNLTYSIPVPAGRYMLKLHFAETWFGPNKPGKGGAGDRLFDVLCNGIALLHNLDIYKEAGGGDRELVKTFHNIEPTPQGRLQITFMARRNYACINAIEVLDEAR